MKQRALFSSVSFSHQLVRNLSTTNPHKWNSLPNPKLRITHPTLLLIESCNSMSHAKQIHGNMTRTGLFFHLFPVSRLLSFIALDKNGDFGYAKTLFGQILEPNVYIWNAMIRGCAKNSFFDMGFAYFVTMVRECVEMDNRSYVFALKACGGLEDFRVGESVYCMAWKVGFDEDVIVRNGLIHFYSEAKKLDYARRIYNETERKDVVSWTSMIDGLVRNEMVEDGLKLFDEMCECGVELNEVTMVSVLSACARKGDLSVGEKIFYFAETRGIEFTLNMKNAMLDMYIKCGRLDIAKQTFENMEVKDVFTWTTMINGFSKNGEVELARKLFDEMPRRNVVSWNAMIGGYAQNNKPKESLELFHVMEGQGLKPMESTLVSVLSACAQSGYMEIGQRILDSYVKQQKIPLTTILGNAFIDMFAKCGNIHAAREIFHAMKSKDLVSYNSMIVAYASHGEADEALNLFQKIEKEGFKPDEITFVGVLSACAHGGLVKEGWDYFKRMELYGLKPAKEHYSCMVDLLGRVGLLRNAYELIESMPMEPDEAIWGAFLNGCKMHGNVELGKIAAEKIISLDPNDSGTYVLLANLCADKRKLADVRLARSMMRDKGVKKNPGSSSIEVEGRFHEFLVGDESHIESPAIYKALGEILYFTKSGDCWMDYCQFDAVL